MIKITLKNRFLKKPENISVGIKKLKGQLLEKKKKISLQVGGNNQI